MKIIKEERASKGNKMNSWYPFYIMETDFTYHPYIKNIHMVMLWKLQSLGSYFYKKSTLSLIITPYITL